MYHSFGCSIKEQLPNSKTQRLSSNSLIFKIFSFRSMINFELIFGYGMSFFFFQVDIPLLQQHLLEKLSFLYRISFALLLKISSHVKTLCCSTDICVYSFTNINCFDYCGFTINLKINFVVLFQNSSGYSSFFAFPYKILKKLIDL